MLPRHHITYDPCCGWQEGLTPAQDPALVSAAFGGGACLGLAEVDRLVESQSTAGRVSHVRPSTPGHVAASTPAAET